MFLSPLRLVFSRWLSLSCQQDQLTMTLSGSACPMMLCVRDRLLYLHQALSLRVFQLAWHGLADRLDQLIYQDVRKRGRQKKTKQNKVTGSQGRTDL